MHCSRRQIYKPNGLWPKRGWAGTASYPLSLSTEHSESWKGVLKVNSFEKKGFQQSKRNSFESKKTLSLLGTGRINSTRAVSVGSSGHHKYAYLSMLTSYIYTFILLHSYAEFFYSTNAVNFKIILKSE
ncbi:hypothetical protein J5N97_003481 [Dioscorea zingiberensis]|uniref:Uncharacterized protein n=1 Tax=Dioscorea zingiberensis TaxID=325984 RepID=A0A9D5HQ45_9LILI|nr:hypothetical protein J5N97_003481 [Dioscorea zingiberensis]